MKFSFSKLTKHKEQEKSDETVLFVCVENAGRSQMAEGFFRKYAFKINNPFCVSSHLMPLLVSLYMRSASTILPVW